MLAFLKEIECKYVDWNYPVWDGFQWQVRVLIFVLFICGLFKGLINISGYSMEL
jgi:hypothetical protein